MPSVTNPMQQAVGRGCVECIRMLVETPPFYSVDACCGADGLRPIHIAAREGHIQTLRFLSSAGACLQRSDVNGWTALHYGAGAGQIRGVRWLLRHGAKLVLDNQNRSPVEVATEHGHMEIASLLAKQATLNPISSTDICSKTESRASSKRSTSKASGYHQKDTESDFTTGTTKGHKPFTLHAGSNKKASGGDSASSSGNSSLSASASAPSLSPSASSAVSCGCSLSDETTLVKTTSELESEDCQTTPGGSFRSRNSLVTSPTPFYLHPPDKEAVSPQIDFGNGQSQTCKGILKKGNHTRKESTSFASNSPFFLHPPENLVSETQKVVGGKMAPVNSTFAHHHFADPCEISSPKIKVGLAESSSSSSTASPPQTPPGTKSGMAATISECISKFQKHGGNKDGSNFGKKRTDDKNSAGGFIPPPPPPPPPFPPTQAPQPIKAPCPPPPPPPSAFLKPGDSNKLNGSKPGITKESETENDYEDIDDMSHANNQFEHARKLLRTVSAPAASGKDGLSCLDDNESQEKAKEHNAPNGVGKGLLTPTKPPLGCGKLPFIPPHFPEPPQDALIKPSEYLRSIQNKLKSNGNTAGSNHYGSGQVRPAPKVEEALKALGVKINDNNMTLVPEETNAEDEFEEINPERINGFVKLNEEQNRSPHFADSAINGITDMNNNNTDNECKNAYESTTKGTSSNGCGGIKPEELMKVNLRKTPMSRTKSAPTLGRVIEAPVELPKLPGLCESNDMENGQDALIKTNGSISPPPESNSVSKADVIKELAQSMGGLREWKEELKRRQKEQEEAAKKELEQFYQPVNFVHEVPSTDVTGAPIPDWKRQMMAKKAAERARKEAEEQRRLELEAKRQAAIPLWRRQLLQRKETDARYAQ